MKKFLLSLGAFVMGVTAMFADEVVIASGTFDGKNNNITEGWTSTAKGLTRNDCVIVGINEAITSPAIDFTKYESITINIKARRYGTLSNSKATIAAAVGETTLGSADASSTNATTALAPISITDLSALTNGSIVFTCSNATSPGTTHGAGINSIEIKGVEKEVPAAPFADGDYIIKNKAAQQYLGGGNEWGTHASVGLPQWFTLTQTEGAYTLDSHQSNGGDSHFLGTGLYVDAAAAPWKLVKGENGVTIENGGNYLAQDGAYAPIKTVTDGTDANAQWEIISKAQFIASLEGATKTAPVDATALINDPEFKRNGNTSNFWTITGFDGTGTPGNFAQGQGGNVASCGESYHSSNGFKAVQTISLPYAGVYQLTAQAFCRLDGGEAEKPYLFMGDKKSEFPLLTGSENNMASAYASFKENKYPVAPITITVAAPQDIQVGVAGSANNIWNIFGQLQLTYLGEDLEEAAQATIASYNALLEMPMNEGVLTQMVAAYNEYVNNPSKTTLTALATAVANAQKSVNEYAAFQKSLNDVTEKVAKLTASGQEAFQTLAAELIASFEGYQMDGDKSADLKAFYVQAVMAQTEVGAEFVDAAPANTQANWVGANGMLAPNWANATAYTFAERYNGGAIAAGDVMTQTFKGLTPGVYEVTLAAAASYTSGRGFECATGDSLSVVFANKDQKNLPVVERTGLAADAEVLYTLKANVYDDLTYGIKNLVAAGNWYAVTVISVKRVEGDLPPVMTITFDKEAMTLTFSPSDKEAYFYGMAASDYAINEYGINPETYTEEEIISWYKPSEWDSMIDPEDGVLVKGDYVIDLSIYVANLGYGDWTAWSNFVSPDLTVSETAICKFNIEAPASTMTVASTDLTGNGGKIKFSADIILANYVEIATCDVKKGDEVVSQATLTLNEDAWDVLDVVFDPALGIGTYTMDLTGVVLEYETFLPFVGTVEFTVETPGVAPVAAKVLKSINYGGYTYTNWSTVAYNEGADYMDTKVELYDGKVVVKDWTGSNDKLTISYDENGNVTDIAEEVYYEGYGYWLNTTADIDNYPSMPGCYVYYDGYSTVQIGENYGLILICCYSYNEASEYPYIIVEWGERPLASCDLTKDMFHNWTTDDATAEITSTPVYPAYELNTATGLPYGDGNVYYLNYADLSKCSKLEITVTEGAPRCCFNRAGDNGTVMAETPRDAKYETVENNVYTIDIKQIVADQGFAHLHCIKGNNWANVTVTSIKLYAESEEDFPTAIESINVENIETVIDLQGRKVSEVKAGQIYLIGGKKIMK